MPPAFVNKVSLACSHAHISVVVVAAWPHRQARVTAETTGRRGPDIHQSPAGSASAASPRDRRRRSCFCPCEWKARPPAWAPGWRLSLGPAAARRLQPHGRRAHRQLPGRPGASGAPSRAGTCPARTLWSLRRGALRRPGTENHCATLLQPGPARPGLRRLQAPRPLLRGL